MNGYDGGLLNMRRAEEVRFSSIGTSSCLSQIQTNYLIFMAMCPYLNLCRQLACFVCCMIHRQATIIHWVSLLGSMKLIKLMSEGV